MKKTTILIPILSLITSSVMAGDVSILHAKLTQKGTAWKVDVTLKHADTGWDHYANAWRIVDEKGVVLATRVLAHPHVNEQPFTRSIHYARIPADIKKVTIEASDTVHKWSPDKLHIDLTSQSGKRYEVKRN